MIPEVCYRSKMHSIFKDLSICDINYGKRFRKIKISSNNLQIQFSKFFTANGQQWANLKTVFDETKVQTENFREIFQGINFRIFLPRERY